MRPAERPNDQTFSSRDVQEWVHLGIISAAQADQILLRPRTGIASRRFDLLTIAYYAGGLTVLLAYTIFMGQQWQRFGPLAQTAIAAFSIGALWVIGFVLRKRASRLGGDLLIFAGTGAMPLLVYSLQKLLGLGDIAGTLSYSKFYTAIAPSWVTMEVVSIATAIGALLLTRFPLHALLIAHWSWFLSLDGARLVTGSTDWTWGDREWAIGLAVGLALLALGVILRQRASRNYSVWLYIYGFALVITNTGALAAGEPVRQGLIALLGTGLVTVGVLVGARGQRTARGWFYVVGHALMLSYASQLAMQYEGVAGIAFLVLYLAVVVLSVSLQSRAFLVFGALGCYGYVSYLAFKLFADSLGFPFALAITGLLIVLSATAYERVGRRWLQGHLNDLSLTRFGIRSVG